MSVLDISRYQGNVNFQAVKTAGISTVIAKMGGGNAGVYVDADWVTNRDGIRAAGLRLGSYYFNGPGDAPDVAADFHFHNIDWQPGDLVVIDVEGRGIAWSTSEVLIWVNRMLAHGVPATDIGVYMSESVVYAYEWSPVVATGAFLWVASYGANTGTPGTPPSVIHWPAWSLWQYTSNGTVPGVSGRVDLSVIAPGWSGGNITPLNNFSEGDDDMPKLIHITTNPVNPSPINAIGTGSIFEVDTYGYEALGSLDVANAYAKVDGPFIDVTAEEAIVILQNASARRVRDHIDTVAAAPTLSAAQITAIASQVTVPAAPVPDLSGVESAVAAVAAELTALDTASASYHTDLAATLAKGFTITGTATPTK